MTLYLGTLILTGRVQFAVDTNVCSTVIMACHVSFKISMAAFKKIGAPAPPQNTALLELCIIAEHLSVRASNNLAAYYRRSNLS